MSAWASTQRLVLAQEAVDAKDNECAAILSILDRLTIKGALVTIDAIATNPAVAKAITDKGGDYILALQPTLHGEVDAYFSDPATTGLATLQTIDKDHGRIETRTTTVSQDVGWLTGDRRHPEEPRFVALKSLIRSTTQVERKGKVTSDTRYFIASASLPLSAPRRRSEAIGALRACTGSSTSSSDKTSPACAGDTALRTWPSSAVSPSTWSEPGKGRHSIKTARKTAAWSTDALKAIVAPNPN